MTEEPQAKNVIEKLAGMGKQQGLDFLEKNLLDLQGLIQEEMNHFQKDLNQALLGSFLVQKGANELVRLGGKRLRPLCVMLAAQIGKSDGIKARELGIAVELIHNATLLHDDVVDLAEKRRGAPAVRTLYGNALSIFAGDWLLIEALRRVERVGISFLLTRLFSVVEEMIFAESLQLERRGTIDTNREVYFQIISGKTASLFRFSLLAGGTVGQLSEKESAALAEYGQHLGMAFQLIDDLLDFTADEATLGKALFTDLHEGKMTFPLIVACEREKALKELLEKHLKTMNQSEKEMEPSQKIEHTVLEAVHRLGSLTECRSLARWHIEQAQQCLISVPHGPATRALALVAEETIRRNM